MMKYLIVVIFFSSSLMYSQSLWKVPEAKKTVKNPYLQDVNSVKSGAKIFKSLCASCHGNTGKGDVPAMQSLQTKPTNLTTSVFQHQTDGSIFYKLSEGKGMMAPYKNMLSEKERWEVVNYLRTLAVDDSVLNKEASNMQETVKEDGQSVETFPFSQVINAKTTRIIPKKSFGFTIQHRFGATKLDDTFIKNFMGLDMSANIRFAFEIPVNNRLYFEIGRTRYGKFYDVGGKYLILKQTKNNSIPLSFAVYANVAVNTDTAPQYDDTATFGNGTLFDFRFYHRLYYDAQMIVSKKFTDNFSAQIAGEFIWRNLTPYNTGVKEDSYVIAFPVSFRYRLSLRTAMSVEIMPNTHKNTLPISFGYEISSSGNHVFQLMITNSDRVLPQNIFTSPTLNYGNEGFMLGFNLTRYF